MLAIRLMRMGAKKSPSYRVVVKEKLSKRDGAYIENVGFYNPTRQPAEVRLDIERVNYWLERGAQPTDTVRQLIKSQTKTQAAAAGGDAAPAA
ncbi:MAG TPA: 30S ribosomal protein S16 [Pyrinomonadaceae bacterium]|nr:30S ribosomal protein S16 [Pyrinomonadaceae bacterium]